MKTTLSSELAPSSNSATRNADAQNPAELVAQLLDASSLPVHGALELPGRDPIFSDPTTVY